MKHNHLLKLRAKAIAAAVRGFQKQAKAWKAYSHAAHRASQETGTPKFAAASHKARVLHVRYLTALKEYNRLEKARNRASKKAFPKGK